LARLRGETLTAAVIAALRSKLERERRGSPAEVAASLMEIGARYAALPDADARTADQILGYDENGLPT
jgi:antitoxin VapB